MSCWTDAEWTWVLNQASEAWLQENLGHYPNRDASPGNSMWAGRLHSALAAGVPVLVWRRTHRGERLIREEWARTLDCLATWVAWASDPALPRDLADRLNGYLRTLPGFEKYPESLAPEENHQWAMLPASQALRLERLPAAEALMAARRLLLQLPSAPASLRVAPRL